MTEPYTIRVRRIEEHVVPGHRLGRHVHHDSRSLAYPFRAPRRVPIVTVEHKRNAPILDQGDLGSCTGNAMTGALATSPDFDGLPAGHPALTEKEAVALYSAATKLDSYPGSYPPSDTGSDGTSVCKAAQKAGLISGYTHATSVDAVLQALMSGPVLFGIDWYDSFDTPDSSGIVAIAKGASVRGGHEIVARQVDADRKLIGMDNSWGTSWGRMGSFWFSYDTLDALLSGSDGDATVPVPVSAPAPIPVPPQPTPVPPADADQVFAAVLRMDDRLGHQWVLENHIRANRKVAQAAQTWLSEKGL